MRKIDLEQGSEAWLNWRKGLITATEASCIMGINPYCTIYKSWQRKVGIIPEQVETEPMRRGKRDEPIARELFIKEYGINMTPVCIESDTYNFIGSSLDGMSDCGEFILEIKSQIPVHKIPEFHLAQIQHQLLSTDGKAKKAFYVSHWDGVNTTFEVFPDAEWMSQYLKKAKDYWRCVALFDPPEMADKDYVNMEAESDWNSYANEYRKACEQIKTLEETKESYKKELIKLCKNNNCFGGGIKVLSKKISGRIDYDSIPELQNIDVEKYRKPASLSWTIMVDKSQAKLKI